MLRTKPELVHTEAKGGYLPLGEAAWHILPDIVQLLLGAGEINLHHHICRIHEPMLCLHQMQT